jgi:hypothetical protein
MTPVHWKFLGFGIAGVVCLVAAYIAQTQYLNHIKRAGKENSEERVQDKYRHMFSFALIGLLFLTGVGLVLFTVLLSFGRGVHTFAQATSPAFALTILFGICTVCSVKILSQPN